MAAHTHTNTHTQSQAKYSSRGSYSSNYESIVKIETNDKINVGSEGSVRPLRRPTAARASVVYTLSRILKCVTQWNKPELLKPKTD